jgi:hypothetical protein
MLVILKIPIVMLLWIVWWAVRNVDAEMDLPADGGSGDRLVHERSRPRRPRPPRRGPHAEPPPRPPSRVRASGRRLPAPLR